MSQYGIEEVKNLLKGYFKAVPIVANQIHSWNWFATFGLQQIVEDTTIALPGYTVKFGQVSLTKPQLMEEDRSLRLMYPMDARRLDVNYDVSICCDITETYEDGTEKHHSRVIIGRTPVMLGSSICNLSKLSPEEKIKKGECPSDPGGYFIIKGNERVLVGQMRNVYNQVFVLRQKPTDKFKLIAETRSMSVETGHSILLQAMIGSDDRTLLFSLPYIKEHIPIGVVFKALGCIDDEEIAKLIGVEDQKCLKYIRFILRDSFFCQTQKEAIDHIGQYALHTISKDKEHDYAWQVVETELLPHLGITGTIKEQLCFLGHMVRKLILTSAGLRNEDDRDNYACKRVEIAGTLFFDIFRNIFKKYTLTIKTRLEKRKQRPDVISIISRLQDITKSLHKCLSSGNWGVQKNASYVRTGVSQILDRMTYCATLSHLRRILIPVGKEGKNSAMRQIHSSSFGFVCPCETPEGSRVGIVLNFALMAQVSKRISPVDVRRVIESMCRTIVFVEDMDYKDMGEASAVSLNGSIIGFTNEPEDTAAEIRELRRKGFIDHEVSVAYDIVDNDIRIFCDEGRFIRPFLNLKNNKLLIKPAEKFVWNNLIRQGIISYLDASEIENTVVAMTPEMLKVQHNDYCEIHPSVMLGVMAGLIPFSDHSQSPRNCYQSSMGKQALGMPILSYNLRTDTLLHVLHYPQKPLVKTMLSDVLDIGEMPSGLNAIVAILAYSGYNQEDSVMLNLSSIQRGLFCLTSYHTIDCIEKKRDTYSREEICVPPLNSPSTVKRTQPGYFKRKDGNYSLLDADGIIRPRRDWDEKTNSWVGPATVVRKGDVLVGKIIVTGSKSGEETRIDASVVIQPGDEGVIDRVHVCITPNGYKLVKVVIRVTRSPTLGDKLASRAAQKGTIGMVYRQEDMPFSDSTGMTPDIIINPLCLGGDSLIMLDNQNCRRIDEIVTNEKDYCVRTVNPSNFIEQTTDIHSSFSIQPERKIVKVRTWSGREITCTDDHQFLIGENKWCKAVDLRPNQDLLTIIHSTQVLNEVGELPEITWDHTRYKMPFTITEEKLQILARLLGSIETDGHLMIRSYPEDSQRITFRTLFYLGEEKDAENMSQDIVRLGFTKPVIRKVTSQKDGKKYMTTYKVEPTPNLGYVLYKLGAHTGRKSENPKKFPEWLKNASLEVKRQFLCGIQGGDGTYISVNEKTVQQQVRVKPTKMTARKIVFDEHMSYMNGIKELFTELGIVCTIRVTQPKNEISKEIGLAISVEQDNLERYANLINYAYCDHKQRRSRLPIEFLRLRNRGIRLPYNKMKELHRGDAVSMYVDSVEEVNSPRLVYDFATTSENHSFVANSIVVHNCMPSRMTVNQLIECALGKECAISGTYGDATPFTEESTNVADKLVDRVSEKMKTYGFEAHGWETLRNGMTGEIIHARVFMGPTYYQRLKHMVDDKMHARATGHVTMLTRQPLEGRSRDGGELTPQWYLIVLLVRITAGNIAKNREILVVVGF